MQGGLIHSCSLLVPAWSHLEGGAFSQKEPGEENQWEVRHPKNRIEESTGGPWYRLSFCPMQRQSPQHSSEKKGPEFRQSDLFKAVFHLLEFISREITGGMHNEWRISENSEELESPTHSHSQYADF